MSKTKSELPDNEIVEVVMRKLMPLDKARDVLKQSVLKGWETKLYQQNFYQSNIDYDLIIEEYKKKENELTI